MIILQHVIWPRDAAAMKLMHWFGMCLTCVTFVYLTIRQCCPECGLGSGSIATPIANSKATTNSDIECTLDVHVNCDLAVDEVPGNLTSTLSNPNKSSSTALSSLIGLRKE